MRTYLPAATLLLSILFIGRVNAQTALPMNVPAVSMNTSAAIPELPIALPAGAVVITEIDAADKDLLGVYKSLLHGFSTPAPGLATPAMPSAAPGSKEAYVNALMKMLSDGQIEATMKDIHRIHTIAYTLPPAVLKALEPNSVLDFYEKPMAAMGGHRIVFVNVDPHILIYGFDEPRGMSAIFQMDSNVLVYRADGYPDLTSLGEEMRAITALGAEYGMQMMSSHAHEPSPAAGKAPLRKKHIVFKQTHNVT